MTWEEKTEMTTFLNTGEYSKATKLMFDTIDTFDEQAMDMFLTGFDLLVENIMPIDIAMHVRLNERFNKIKSGSFRTAIRMAVYEGLIQKVLEEQVHAAPIPNYEFEKKYPGLGYMSCSNCETTYDNEGICACTEYLREQKRKEKQDEQARTSTKGH